MNVLLEILEWVKSKSEPSKAHKYSRCVVCGHSWWDEKEEHMFDCWVPRAKNRVAHFPLELSAADTLADAVEYPMRDTLQGKKRLEAACVEYRRVRSR